MRQAVHWIIIAIAAAAPAAHAQVFKCKDAQGRVMYSDTGCTSLQQGHLIERERSMEEKHRERAQAYRAQQDKQALQLREREREMREQEDRAMRAAAEPAAPRHKGYAERLAERNANVQSTIHRNPPPGGIPLGMSRREREAALARANTQQERDEAYREATTVIPGLPGLTAHQADVAQRLRQAKLGEPIPPSNLPPAERRRPVDDEPIKKGPSQITHCAGGICHDTRGDTFMKHGNSSIMTSTEGKPCFRTGPFLECH